MGNTRKSSYNLELIGKYFTKEFDERYMYNGNDLGAVWSEEKTSFKLWSPVADKVILNLYKSGDGEDLISSTEMAMENNGVWCTIINGNIKKTYYTYSAEINGKRDEFCDPYAKSCGVNGKRAMVIDLDETNPEGWDKDSNPNIELSLCESVIYELHTRDFSADDSSDIENKGKFLGLVEEGRTLNGKGKIKTGIDHLKELGITHLHLLPFYDYATVDEAKEYNVNEYNWGYDPLNYNVPEGSYSTNAFDGNVRVKELKETIKKLHENGISVVMDVVYNHTFSEDFCFNKAVPGYFYRIDADGYFSNGSECGNDTASERAMVSKYIVDSVLYWAKEYHIDGFRFDLVGLIDIDTINKIRDGLDKIRKNIMLYGEGWDLKTKLVKKDVILSTQKNIDKLRSFAMFSDNIRDAIKGSVFEEDEKGFISGNVEGYDELCDSILGLPEWSESPEQVINYTSCHDNYTLFDKIHLCNEGITFEDAVKQNLLAASIVFLSQGIPLIHAGEEMLRTKVDEDGKYVSDSVRSSDYVNSIKWANLNKKEYYDVYEYYKGLIAFRKSHKAFMQSDKDKVMDSITFIETGSKKVIAYELKDNNQDIYVIFNADSKEQKLVIGSSEDEYMCYIKEEKAGNDVIEMCNGNICVSGISCMVLIKK